MNRFWNWVRNDANERTLRLEGSIDTDSFWGDSVTPQSFREELEAETGDITVWINSPGGDVFAAAEIYTMLKEYGSKHGMVTVKIDAIAASAASVVAMAGDRVLMSPVAMLMIHDPMTIAAGNAQDMEKAIVTLNEVKESIITAYRARTGLSRNKISELMSNETWMSAKKAVELGFADEVLYAKKKPEPEEAEEEPEKEPETQDPGQPEPEKTAPETPEEEPEEDRPEKKKPRNETSGIYSSRIAEKAALNRMAAIAGWAPEAKENAGSVPVQALLDKLELLR